ncbi:tRNA wybutosine-synthesizing protein 1 [Strigomonas culicis]|uniref:tRNA wybutosine-synthesizing protein 1 n=1 Tax=Strigomonas culicis TaxID=28005 RepID=S9TYP3_9TRYP|nr:tRNA wybutosine-synthesizing protein 1 [Strigomonas culicis]|eukprot:EPY23622.1 tRNA wybutosine-synthesizing protein 1 [Strigomonas culicis]
MRDGAVKQICRPMLSEKRRASLGSMYSLVGTHSAVKLCRWQKSMMRGRGGCYKWTMYGIRSHQCMEATPSMACANNCVFCWRHNTNPTAAEWRWQVDDPKDIVEGMLATQKTLINGVRGMPGVTEEGLAEALNPRHCALSLVGEPVLYPYVNEFLGLLHAKGISTFLVNNGQFPDAVAHLSTVTQLYLSVDAPNRKTMKVLDRPILPDYWERFNHSVDIMRRRAERTVFRLTLIDGFNMSEENIGEYKELFDRGQPHFVELKRLTPAFSGNTKTILRIKNVPAWDKMKQFAVRLCETILDGDTYHVASIHEHSGCILLAQKQFFIHDQPHTWIDFTKFNALINSPEREKAITPHDYLLPTPVSGAPHVADGGL